MKVLIKKRETMKRYIFQKMLKINFTLFVCSYRASGAMHYEKKYAWKIHQLTFLLKIFKKCNKWSIHKDALQLLLHNSRHFIISGSFISQRLGCHSETSSFILRWLTFLSRKWSFLCWWKLKVWCHFFFELYLKSLKSAFYLFYNVGANVYFMSSFFI